MLWFKKIKSLYKSINKDIDSHNVPKDEEFLKDVDKYGLLKTINKHIK